MALVTLKDSSDEKTPWDIINVGNDNGLSTAIIGGVIQPFQAVVVDKTFADMRWHEQAAVTEVALPAIIPHGGGPVKFSIPFPVDELVNMESVKITVGYKVKTRAADTGATRNLAIADNIAVCNDRYIVKTFTATINNQPQFGTMQNRDHAMIERRLRLLQNLDSDWYSSIMRIHASKNGFLPCHQTEGENRIGRSGIYADAASGTVRTAFAALGDPSHTKWSDLVKYLIHKDTKALLSGKENDCRVETESEGILGATCMYPGIISSFQATLDFKGIYELLYSDISNAIADPQTFVEDTGGIDRAFIEITRIICEYQSALPSTALWDALSNAATAGGGVAKSPSYPWPLINNFGGPKEFTPATTALHQQVTGHDVPDTLEVAIQAFGNQNTKVGNEAYLDWPGIRKQSFAVTTQGRQAFKNDGTSMFEEATHDVTAANVHFNVHEIHTLELLSPQKQLNYMQHFLATIKKKFSIAQGRPLENYSRLLDDPTVWIHGNAFNIFSTSTCVSTQNDLKSPVYASPFIVESTLNGPTDEAYSQHLVGRSKAVLVNSQNNALIVSRFVSGTDIAAVLPKLRGEEASMEAESMVEE